MKDVGLKMTDVGLKMKDVGFKMKDVGLKMKDVGFKMKDVGLKMKDALQGASGGSDAHVRMGRRRLPYGHHLRREAQRPLHPGILLNLVHSIAHGAGPVH
jgi:hypothetical protein